MSDQLRPRRPFGVTVMVILQLISILVLVTNISLFDLVNELVGNGPGQLFALLAQWLGNSSLTMVIKSVIILVVLAITVGLWRLQRWAWVLVMIQLGVGMGINLWLYFNGKPLYVTMLINVVMVFYLNQHEVQQAFEHKTRFKEASWTT